MYVTPMDIYRLDNDSHNKTDAGVDLENRYAVVPAFNKYPVNDRMIYGPYCRRKNMGCRTIRSLRSPCTNDAEI
jgi:hypothetical protein